MKDINGYEGLYAIDEEGIVFSYKMNDFLVPTWKVPTGGTEKRWIIELYKNGKITRVPINDLIWETYKDCLDQLTEIARIEITNYAEEAGLI